MHLAGDYLLGLQETRIDLRLESPRTVSHLRIGSSKLFVFPVAPNCVHGWVVGSHCRRYDVSSLTAPCMAENVNVVVDVSVWNLYSRGLGCSEPIVCCTITLGGGLSNNSRLFQTKLPCCFLDFFLWSRTRGDEASATVTLRCLKRSDGSQLWLLSMQTILILIRSLTSSGTLAPRWGTFSLLLDYDQIKIFLVLFRWFWQFESSGCVIVQFHTAELFNSST